MKVKILACFFAVLWLAGCASAAGSALGAVANIALEMSGLKKPEKPDIPESQRPPRKVALSIAAGKNLNAGDNDAPLALVVRIYKLKDATGFYQTPFNAFVNAGQDKALLGEDLIESREVTLVPGQSYQWTEAVPWQAGALAVVGFFHSPAPQRWRFAFNPAESEKTGILMGAHACAFTVTKGTVITPQNPLGAVPALNLLSEISCPGSPA
jgi:type VI secretion system protein VasD